MKLINLETMDSLILFLKIIAWPTGIVSTIIGAFTLYLAISYPGSLEETLDKLNGVKRTYYPMKFFIIAIICFAFIIAF